MLRLIKNLNVTLRKCKKEEQLSVDILRKYAQSKKNRQNFEQVCKKLIKCVNLEIGKKYFVGKLTW